MDFPGYSIIQDLVSYQNWLNCLICVWGLPGWLLVYINKPGFHMIPNKLIIINLNNFEMGLSQNYGKLQYILGFTSLMDNLSPQLYPNYLIKENMSNLWCCAASLSHENYVCFPPSRPSPPPCHWKLTSILWCRVVLFIEEPYIWLPQLPHVQWELMALKAVLEAWRLNLREWAWSNWNRPRDLLHVIQGGPAFCFCPGGTWQAGRYCLISQTRERKEHFSVPDRVLCGTGSMKMLCTWAWLWTPSQPPTIHSWLKGKQSSEMNCSNHDQPIKSSQGSPSPGFSLCPKMNLANLSRLSKILNIPHRDIC